MLEKALRASDSNSDRWEALASAALAAAEYMTDLQSKELMITIARNYKRLAKRASELEARGSSTTPRPLQANEAATGPFGRAVKAPE